MSYESRAKRQRAENFREAALGFGDCRIEILAEPTAADREAVVGPLAEFNAQSGYPVDSKPVAILLKDEAGAAMGGLWGNTVYGWLFVEFLSIPESMRGQRLGVSLMGEAEKIAKARGCVGSWLTTFTFQARGFYEKLGYSLFAQLEESPDHNDRMFLRKRF